VASEGLSLGMPEGWQKIDMDAGMLDESLKALESSNPEFAKIFDAQARQMAAAGIKFFGFDSSPDALTDGFATNVNILVQPLPIDLSLDQYTEVNVDQIKGQLPGVSDVKVETVQLGALEARELSYGYSLNTAAGGQTPIALSQYIVIQDKNALVMTFTTTEAKAATYTPLFRQMAETLTFGK
jgi:hypothetical protein